MSKDYAKGKRAGKKAPARATRKPASASRHAPNASTGKTWLGFAAGTAFGVFLSFLTWLTTLDPGVPDTGPTLNPTQPRAQSGEQPSAEPHFEFYTMAEKNMEFPKETAEFGESVASDIGEYLLQAGSFRRGEDADRRRAELILLGLVAAVKETHGDNGRWFRVQVGPFETHSKLQQARALLADQQIDTLLLKRSR
jgi:cell division septation protein DedD